jgi:hypothetical protein
MLNLNPIWSYNYPQLAELKISQYKSLPDRIQ